MNYLLGYINNYNIQVVILGVALLGLSSGALGTFLVFKRQALIADVMSHSTLVGVVCAYLFLLALGDLERTLLPFLIGGGISGFLGVFVCSILRNRCGFKEDSAQAIVLSVFFGLGVVLISIAQNLEGASIAGLESFIYGKSAGLLARDVWWILGVSLIVLLLLTTLFKELTLIVFDPVAASARRFPVGIVEAVLLVVTAALTVVGIQSVGLMLMVGLFIIPPATARFWSDRISRVCFIAALFGACSAIIGSISTVRFDDLPSGPMIILSSSGLFFISMLFAPYRGVLAKLFKRRRFARRIRLEHLLRSMYEITEDHEAGPFQLISIDQIARHRGVKPEYFRSLVGRGVRKGILVVSPEGEAVALTNEGFVEAARITRIHRLWEQYLIHAAEIGADHVDHDADLTEHVSSPAIVLQLERYMEQEGIRVISPHIVKAGSDGRVKLTE